MLDGTRRQLVVRAFVTVLAVRVLLWVAPFRTLHRYVTGHSAPRSASTLAVNDVTWAVTAVARTIPQATCLTQALSAVLLLARYGHRGELRIGVARAGEALRAHAWVEQDGKVVIGDSELDAFVAMPPGRESDA